MNKAKDTEGKSEKQQRKNKKAELLMAQSTHLWDRQEK
jgi:hypothetical protein